MTRLAVWKSNVKLIHRWVGIFALALFGLSALTGVAIQWDSELTKFGTERDVWRSVTGCQRCPLAQAAERLAAHIGDDRFAIDIQSPEFEHTAMAATAARLDRSGADIARRFAIDPSSLAIRELTERPISLADRIMAWTYQFHHSLLLGLFGTVIMWIAAFLLFIMPLTGLLLWWPMVRFKKGVFVTTPRIKGRAWYYDRHRIIGFYAVSPIVFLASTGFLLTLLELFPRPAPVPGMPGGSAVALAEHKLRPGVTPVLAQDYAQALYPDLVPVRMQIERAQHRNTISLVGQDGLRLTRVTVNTQTGRPTAIDSPESGVVAWTVAMARVLHNGSILGIVGRILNMLVAVVILFLAWSGFALWRARRSAKRKSSRRSLVL